MSEGADYDPGPWRGHDFGAARAAYDRHAGRSYSDAVASGKVASDLVPPSIITQSSHPCGILCDVTGSMGGWPNTIFSKLPYLDHELRTEYLGEDAEVSYAAVSDTGDTYPFQAQPFSKRTGMKDSLTNLNITEGGSGPGHYCEAYGVAALYYARNVQMPRAVIKPPLIIIGDEKPYHLISKQEAADYAKAHIEEAHLSVEAIFAELVDIYSVYLVLKPYGNERLMGDKMEEVTTRVYDCWKGLLGEERIALLPEAGRVVDVIFGILAQEAGRVDYFREELEGRQRPEQVETVYESLRTVHAGPSGLSRRGTRSGSGRSVMRKPTGGKASKPLV